MTDDQNFETLFESCHIMDLKLPNRFIRSATLEGMASYEDGTPSLRLKTLYEALAKGGVGLISTGACTCDRGWIPAPRGSLLMDNDEILPAWEDTVEAVHNAGALISLQMAPFFFLDDKLVGPSPYQDGVHELTVGEIEKIALTYGESAARARNAGMDAVQVHAGHGYPLCQFISPYYNKRKDKYGGSAENRTRILVDIRKAIAEKAGSDFPVWIKMNAFDGLTEGLTGPTAVAYGPILSKAGYTAIEVSGGSPDGSYDSRGPIKKKEWVEGYFLEQASLIKSGTDIPVVAVGGIRTIEMAGSILKKGVADLISMSRPFICEPNLIDRWRSGDSGPSQCVNCDGCTKMMRNGKGISCIKKKVKTQ